MQAYIRAGLLDEMLISLVPVFLGDGTRPLDDLGTAPRRPEQLEVVEAPGVTEVVKLIRNGRSPRSGEPERGRQHPWRPL